MGVQGNNPHIFLWHLYDQNLKKKIFFDPTHHKFGTQPSFHPIFNHFLTLKEYYGNKYLGDFCTL